MGANTSLCGDLIVKAVYAKKPRFKAGSELSTTVRMKVVDIQVTETDNEEGQFFEAIVRFNGCLIADENGAPDESNDDL